MAAISGLLIQERHIRKERKNDIKKIQSILKLEFEDLYRVMINERQIVTNVKLRSEEDFNSLIEHKMNISDYLEKAGGSRWVSLVWDAVISSGNLIKLNNDEIKITQYMQHGLKQYNKKMSDAHNNIVLAINNRLNRKLANDTFSQSDMLILEQYIDTREQIVNESINRFNELDKLQWFNRDKIKEATVSRASE